VKKITILVADSQLLFAQCLGATLGRVATDFWVLEEMPTSGPEVIVAAKTWTPDIILLDSWISGMDGAAVTRAILDGVPHCKVLLLSWFHSPDQIREVISAGAAGYLPKSVSLDQLVEAIRQVCEGALAPAHQKRLKNLAANLTEQGQEMGELADRFKKLTPREVQVLLFLSRGGRNQEIADELCISRATLKSHIRNILAKVGARSHSEAVAMALKCGWIQI